MSIISEQVFASSMNKLDMAREALRSHPSIIIIVSISNFNSWRAMVYHFNLFRNCGQSRALLKHLAAIVKSGGYGGGGGGGVRGMPTNV